MTATAARWSRGGYAKQYDWPQCKYCGRAQVGECKPVDCLACGSRQCFGNGYCHVCLIGYLPGWGRSNEQNTCGYRRCEADAVARYTRVGQVCNEHLVTAKRAGGRSLTLADYIAEQVALRDSGSGTFAMPGWRWVE